MKHGIWKAVLEGNEGLLQLLYYLFTTLSLNQLLFLLAVNWAGLKNT